MIATDQKLLPCDLFERLLDGQLFDKNQAYKLFSVAETMNRNDAVDFFFKMLKKRHPMIRGLAARSLGNIQEESAMTELAKLLSITEYAYMIDALGNIGISNMGALSIIAKIGKHCSDSNLRNHAKIAFEKLAKKI